MTQFARPTPAAADYDSTIIGALELSEKKWVLAVQLPGVKRHSRHVVEARGDELAAFVERLKARCAVAGHNIKRVILTHEAGRDGFWLARFLVRRGASSCEPNTRGLSCANSPGPVADDPVPIARRVARVP
jgi:hypothetical protein